MNEKALVFTVALALVGAAQGQVSIAPTLHTNTIERVLCEIFNFKFDFCNEVELTE